MQQFFSDVLVLYGWKGIALSIAALVLFGVQIAYTVRFARIASFRNSRRPLLLGEKPPVSVIVPLYGESYPFIEEQLPALLAQDYAAFEVVVVYIGHNNDFYEDLSRLKLSHPALVTTRITFNPRYPISRKMALNIGIKSAHFEHIICTTTDAEPISEKWISLMVQGFERGDVVLGYCGIEPGKGFVRCMMRQHRLRTAIDWLSRAVTGKPYRGIRHNIGFTRQLYFGANGFSHLNMNIGDDDLFMQRIMTATNVSVALSPRATLVEHPWGGLRWWCEQLHYYGTADRFYPRSVRAYRAAERWSRFLFFAVAIAVVVLLPLELKIAAAALLVIRLAIVQITVNRICRRLGESGIASTYFLYDFFSPLLDALVWITLLRKDHKVWR